MAKRDLTALKAKFSEILAGVWGKFEEMVFKDEDEAVQFKGDSPFDGTYWMELVDPGLSDDEKIGIRLDMAWLEGVKDATGWLLSQPGPREWSPR